MNVVPLERCFGSPGKYRVPTTTRRQRDLALAGSIPLDGLGGVAVR